MLSRLARRLTYANVVASLALFLVLSGGSAYAAKQLIGARQIARNAIDSSKVRDNSITSADVRNGTLTAKDFKRGVLPSAGSGSGGANGADGSAGANGSAGAPGPAGPAGRDGAGLVVWKDFGAVSTRYSYTWQTVGGFRWTQPANSLETIGGYYEWPRNVYPACAGDLKLQYQIVVDGREISYDNGNGAPDDEDYSRAASFPNMTFLTAEPSDPGVFGAELPLLPAAAAKEHTLELRVRNGCNAAVTMNRLALYVTRFVG
jgi:hypothetical protein